jgi:hypothetical protein
MTRARPGFSFQLSAREGGVGHAVSSAFRALKTVSYFAGKHIFETEEKNEHLDDSICSVADRLAGRFHGVPRSGWPDSPTAGFRRNFADFALCAGPARRVRQADTRVRRSVPTPTQLFFWQIHGLRAQDRKDGIHNEMEQSSEIIFENRSLRNGPNC